MKMNRGITSIFALLVFVTIFSNGCATTGRVSREVGVVKTDLEKKINEVAKNAVGECFRIERTVDQGFKKVDEEFASTQRRFTQVDQRFEKVEGDAKTLGARVTKVEDLTTKLASRISSQFERQKHMLFERKAVDELDRPGIGSITIEFGTGQFAVTGNRKKELDAGIKFLREKNLVVTNLIGLSSIAGGVKATTANEQLPWKRIVSVRAYLIANASASLVARATDETCSAKVATHERGLAVRSNQAVVMLYQPRQEVDYKTQDEVLSSALEEATTDLHNASEALRIARERLSVIQGELLPDLNRNLGKAKNLVTNTETLVTEAQAAYNSAAAGTPEEAAEAKTKLEQAQEELVNAQTSQAEIALAINKTVAEARSLEGGIERGEKILRQKINEYDATKAALAASK